MAKSARPSRKVKIGAREIFAHGLQHSIWNDFYHDAMTVGWPTFVAVTAVLFVAINALFAGLYMLQAAPISDVRSGDFLQYFYFSIETLATVGYGDMHPQTHYGHAVASIETFIGLFLTAVLTGVIFSRFSRPRARFVFADALVVTQHDGRRVLSGRLANERLSLVSNASAKLWMSRTRISTEGVRFRGFEELPLERRENPFFALSWTLFHPLDEASPLKDCTPEELDAVEASFVVSVEGHDDSAAQAVYARKTYERTDIRWNHRYVDIIESDGEGRTVVDYRRIHDTVADSAAQPASANNPS